MDYITVTRYDHSVDVYVAYHPDLPGCIATGDTVAEARANLDEFRGEWLTHYRKHGLDIPPSKAFESGVVWRDTFFDV